MPVAPMSVFIRPGTDLGELGTANFNSGKGEDGAFGDGAAWQRTKWVRTQMLQKRRSRNRIDSIVGSSVGNGGKPR